MVARQFDLACDKLEQVHLSEFNAISPLVANSALSCELYLKALFFISNATLPKVRDGHDLSELYQVQDSATQDSIYQAYEKAFLNREVPSQFVGRMSRATFQSELADVKDVFKNWRYIYEIPDASVRPGILSLLRKALRQVVSDAYDGASTESST